MTEEVAGSNSEEWRPVVGFEKQYVVSSRGRIRRIETGRLLKLTVTDRGYAIVNLVDASRSLRRCSHVYNIVMAAFVGPKPPGLTVNHIDGVKTNNSVTNLEYITHRENQQHAIRLGLRPRKLTAQEVREIRDLEGYFGAIRTARLYGIGKSLVGSIRRRASYADID